MKITVLGATGRTGARLVPQALERGHTVTAVVRDPARLPVEPHPRLETAVAEVPTAEALGPLVAGREAVLSSLGAHDLRPTTVRADAAAATVEAMRARGVARLLVVSASGAFPGPGDDPFTRRVLKPVLGRVLRHPFADNRRMEGIVRVSGLDWTIVRPPRLTEGPGTGRYRTRTGRNVTGGLSLSRADLAACLLDLLDDPATVRTVVSVG